MKLKHGIHLAYCTNVHRGETWAETFSTLEQHTLRVKERVCPDAPYAIGLRLGHQTSLELAEPKNLKAFQRWLEQHDCYVFTINGFPYGRFHGGRVKEQVFLPDWTSEERVAYTNRLFDLLVELLPAGVDGSVSTVPGSHKQFIDSADQEAAIRRNVWRSVEHVAQLAERTGRDLHLGLEPEPLGYLENSEEMARFYEQLRDEHPNDERLIRHLGVNYDTCHKAIEFEAPEDVIARYRRHGVRISKLHFSNALSVRPTPETLADLRRFVDVVYFHQVIQRSADGTLTRFKDLDVALDAAEKATPPVDAEWRIHFHIPLHCPPDAMYGNTAGHLHGVMDALKESPELCSHVEMETYTWEVMPREMKRSDVVEQLVEEYRWTLAELGKRGLAAV